MGQPKGILKETVAAGQNVDIAAAADPTYQTLIAAEAALHSHMREKQVWCMTKATFMKFIGMVDSQGQPIASVPIGINGKPERTLLGRTVILNDYMTSLGATIAADTVVAFLFNFKDYVLNTNYQMTVKRYEDNDTEDIVTKAVMLVDGKVIDKKFTCNSNKKSVVDSALSALTIGTLELSPTFDSDVLEYTASTTNASNKITAVTDDPSAVIEIDLDGEAVEMAHHLLGQAEKTL